MTPKHLVLEWAAEYIIRDEPSLYPAISSAITDIRAGIASERDMLKRNGTVVTIVMAAVALVVLGWFSWRIVGRIRRAQTGIREVANGNFNARIDDHSRDELGVLAQDFNALAERMRMVLSLLDGLSDSQARQQALQVIFDESQSYLRTNSLVLIEAQISGRLVISAVAPARDGEVLQGLQLDAHDSLAGLALDTGEPVLLSGLRQHIVQNAHARLVRELTRRLGVASVLAVPIRSERGWLGVLVFGASHEQAFDADKAALMHNLGAVLSHGLDTGQEAPVGGDDRVIPLSGRA